jgi:uncharacterized protein (TIGR03437 family)
MQLSRTLLWLLTFGAVGAWAQPQVIAVTNTADYTPTLSPGSIASIFGTGLAPSAASAAAIPLPKLLNNVSVTVSGTAAPLFYVSPLQINFQVPFEIAAGTATLSVTSGNEQSNRAQVVVAAFSLGIFGDGSGHGVVQNQDQSANSAAHPAAGGSSIVVYVTGIGVTDTQVGDGAAAPGSPPATFAGTATASIGDTVAPVQFIGLTPGSVGLAQVNLQVPVLPTGAYPLQISLNGYQSVSALVSVSGSGSGFQVTAILELVSSFSLPGIGPTFVPGISGVVDNSVALFGNTLYICSPSDVKVVDVTNPATPNYLHDINDPEFSKSAHNCTVNATASHPFLADLVRESQSIAVYDLSSPALPVKASQTSMPLVPRSVAYSGDAGFFGEALFSYSGHEVDVTKGDMVSVDFSNIDQPAPRPLLVFNPAQPETNNSNLRPHMILPSPGILYVASTTASETFNTGTGALDIFDVSNPASIQGIGQVLVPGSTVLLTVTAAGSELLAVGDTRGFSPGNVLANGSSDFPYAGYLTLTMFDITNPRSPQMQGNVIVKSMQPADCGGAVSLGTVALGNDFYAVTCSAPDLNATGGSGNGSLVIVDARDPATPQAYTYGTLPGLGGLAIANGYLYAAVGTGANIYQIHTP